MEPRKRGKKGPTGKGKNKEQLREKGGSDRRDGKYRRGRDVKSKKKTGRKSNSHEKRQPSSWILANALRGKKSLGVKNLGIQQATQEGKRIYCTSREKMDAAPSQAD